MVEGTEGEKIVFSSKNNLPAAGDWFGIYFENGSSGIMDHAIIEYAQYGLHILGASSPQIFDSILRHNQYGVWVANNGGNIPYPTINLSHLYDNSAYNYYVTSVHNWWSQVAPGTVLDARNNCWGTSNEDLIQDSIHDYTDDIRLAQVNYLPWSEDCPCAYDADEDGDVDGSDLFNFIVNLSSGDLSQFAIGFGRTDCQ
jgi:hypothetical protein